MLKVPKTPLKLSATMSTDSVVSRPMYKVNSFHSPTLRQLLMAGRINIYVISVDSDSLANTIPSAQ